VSRDVVYRGVHGDRAVRGARDGQQQGGRADLTHQQKAGHGTHPDVKLALDGAHGAVPAVGKGHDVTKLGAKNGAIGAEYGCGFDHGQHRYRQRQSIK